MKLLRSGLRRTTVAVVSAALAVTAAGCGAGSGGSGDGSEVVIGAAWPLSGAFAHNGQAVLAGAEAAVADINDAGGIKSLDGAKLSIKSVDVGATPQETTAAVTRLLQNKDIVAVAGSWLSSLTLAATEVTERRAIPVVTESFADEVTGREGFSHVFSYAPPSSKIADLLLDAALPSLADSGITVKNVAVVGDNSAAATPLQDGLIAALKARDIKVGVNQVWATPLQDASGVAQKIASGKVDVVFMIAYSFNDVASLTSQMRSRGVDVPVIQNGGQATVPEWRDLGDEVSGLSTFVYTNPLNKSQELSAHIAEKAGVPYAWQDQLGGYLAVQIIAAAIESAGKADPAAVTEALKTLNLDSGPAVDLMPVDSFSFDGSGRIQPLSGVLAQWQKVDGELLPCSVYPADFAVCQPAWK